MSQATQTDIPSALRKTGGLWSYILPPSSNSSNPDATANHTPPVSNSLPATGPSDRSSVSLRLMLGDNKATLQQLSDRVERVLDEAGNARRDVTEAARGIEEAQSGTVKQMQTIVKQALGTVQETVHAHTSAIDAIAARVTNLESTLIAPVLDLSHAHTGGLLILNDVLDRVNNIHATIFSLLPVLPLLQAIPVEINNAQLKTSSVLEQLSAGILRATQDTRLELTKICEEQTRAAVRAMGEMFDAREKTWKEQLDATVGQVRKEVETCKEDWARALSMHRQEMCGLLSIHLTTCAHERKTEGFDSVRGATRSGMDTDRQDPVSSAAQAPTLARRNIGDSVDVVTPRQKETFRNLETADVTFGRTTPEEAGDTERNTPVADPKSKVVVDPDRDVAKDKEPHTVSRREDGSASTSVRIERQLEMETQSTALSSLPEPDPDAPEIGGPQDVATDHQAQGAGRLFGILNKPSRTRSARRSFAVPQSPPFNAHRQPLVTRLNKPTTRLNTRVLSTTNHRMPDPGRHPLDSTIANLPQPEPTESVRATAVGRSAAPLTSLSIVNQPTATNPPKRGATFEGPKDTKRRRTRMISTIDDGISDEDY